MEIELNHDNDQQHERSKAATRQVPVPWEYTEEGIAWYRQQYAEREANKPRLNADGTPIKVIKINMYRTALSDRPNFPTFKGIGSSGTTKIYVALWIRGDLGTIEITKV